DVDVDVGRLRLAVDSNLRQKTLEEEAVLHRIHSRDRETIGDGGVCRASSALTENSLVTGEPYRVPHHQKESGEPELSDDAQLVLELRALLVTDLAPPLTRAFVDFFAEEADIVASRRN